MLRTYGVDMVAASPQKEDETNEAWCRRAAAPVLKREGIRHFLCRCCWFEHGKRTEIMWPGVCDECAFRLQWGTYR